jgi:hypothetical protein
VVREHHEKYGTPPLSRWVCERMGTASATGAMKALQTLARLGYLAAIKTPGVKTDGSPPISPQAAPGLATRAGAERKEGGP